MIPIFNGFCAYSMVSRNVLWVGNNWNYLQRNFFIPHVISYGNSHTTTYSQWRTQKNCSAIFCLVIIYRKKRRLCMLLHTQNKTIAWEGSLHFAMPLLVCPSNYGWGTSAEIPHWWRVTTWIWVALLIGCSKSIRSTRYIRFGSDTSFHGKISGDVMRC